MSPADVIFLQNGFNCGAAEAAKARQLLNIPVWRYHFANNKPGKTEGAWHGDEVTFVLEMEKQDQASSSNLLMLHWSGILPTDY
jgi:hypothetical protein